MKITRHQLRGLIRESLGDEFGPGGADDNRPWGTYAEKGNQTYSDVIVMSPDDYAVLVDGRETYVQDVPSQLENAANAHGTFNSEESRDLIDTLEAQMRNGYVELSIEFKNGKWSW